MDAHERMMKVIVAEMRETAVHTGRAVLSPEVYDAMAAVPREAFVPESERAHAYSDRPLPIGHAQTISQPFIVALMIEMLDLERSDVVLEVGTGSGYQTALLAEIVKQVYSIEVVRELAAAALRRLRDLGYENVSVRHGDGYLGWPEEAPFDAIVVTAAAPEVPAALVAQLRPRGRMVIPVGRPYGRQELLLITKDGFGEATLTPLLPVAFVPMVEMG